MMTDDFFPAKAATKTANVPVEGLQPNPKGRLKEQFHEVARFKHLSPRTEQGMGGAVFEISSGAGGGLAASA